MSRFLPSLLVLALGACGSSSEPDADPVAGAGGAPADGVDEAELILWEVPDLPWSCGLEIDGSAAPASALQGILLSEWNTFVVQNLGERGKPTAAEVEDLVTRFYAEPAQLLAPLIDDLLLIRDHRERHPEIDADEFEHFRHDLEENAGHLLPTLLASLGEDGLREHLENKFRIHQMQAFYAAGLATLSEEQLQAHIARRAEERGEDLEAVLQALAEYPDARAAFEGQINADRAEAAIRAWLDEVRPLSEVVFLDRGGERIVLDAGN